MLAVSLHCDMPAREGCTSPILGASLSQYETNVSIDTVLVLGRMFSSTIACSTPRARSSYLITCGLWNVGEGQSGEYVCFACAGKLWTLKTA